MLDPPVHLEYGPDQTVPYLSCSVSAWKPESTRDQALVTCLRCKGTRYFRWLTGEIKDLFPIARRKDTADA